MTMRRLSDRCYSLSLNARGLAAGTVVALAIGLSACTTNGVPDRNGLFALQQHPVKEFDLAKVQFTAGNYGKAAELYQVAVESDPKNPEGWLGLAAAYDQVGRFDLADRAYTKLTKLVGETPTVLNNRGYSFLLRGKLDKARKLLSRAALADPGNAHVEHNIELLNDKLAALGKPILVVQ